MERRLTCGVVALGLAGWVGRVFHDRDSPALSLAALCAAASLVRVVVELARVGGREHAAVGACICNAQRKESSTRASVKQFALHVHGWNVEFLAKIVATYRRSCPRWASGPSCLPSSFSQTPFKFKKEGRGKG